jgi:DNA-binding GntR family transcriptional regulator
LESLKPSASLERALRDARARVRLLRPQVVRSEVAARSFADHDEIVESLAAGDAAATARAVERNWLRALERVSGEQLHDQERRG